MAGIRMWVISVAAIVLVAGNVLAAPAEVELKSSVEKYFGNLFQRLQQAAAKNPTDETFRDVMKPHLDGIEGLYGSTLLNADWEIRQVYFKAHFLAVDRIGIRKSSGSFIECGHVMHDR